MYSILTRASAAFQVAGHVQATERDLKGKLACLVRLCNISKDCIHHGHQHPVLLGMPGVLNDGDHIRSILSHVD